MDILHPSEATLNYKVLKIIIPPLSIIKKKKKNPIRVIPYEIDYMKNTIKFRKKIIIVVFYVINLKEIRTVGKVFLWC